MTQDDRLRQELSRVRRRWLTGVALRTVARAALGAALVVCAGLAAEWILAPAGAPLVLLAGAALAAAALLVGTVFWPLRCLPEDRAVARFVEERCPELEDRVASAVDVAQGDGPTPFGRLVLGDAVAQLAQVPGERLVRGADLRRAGLQAAASVALFAASLGLGFAPAGRAWDTLAFHLFPLSVTIDVAPGDARVRPGEAFAVTARIDGIDRLPAGLIPVVELRQDGRSQTADMTPDGGAWRLDVPAVRDGFHYRVRILATTSPEYRVTLLVPPRVDRIEVRYEYPAFTGLPPREEEDGGDVYGPAGTEIRLRVLTDRPVEAGEMVMADGSRVTLESRADRMLEGAFRIVDDSSYRVSLVGVDGTDSAGDTEYFIRTMDDRPPDVRVLRPAGDRPVTPLEEVTIEARADDDHGIDRFELVYAVRGGEEQVVSLGGGRSARTVTASYVLRLEGLGVQPGDFVTYYARARDVGRAKPSTEVRSDIFFLEVRPLDEAFFAAQSQAAGAGGGDGSLEQLVAAQKEIIVATWKLDRRSAAGRSESDIRAIARAQGELKARVEQVASRQRRTADPGRLFGPGRDAASGGTETSQPIVLAAEAMGRAERLLDAVQTAEALPHEMEALNQLLRVEADVRQRQVARQSGQGGGPGRTGNQDLSTLFDRELQRQQQTNYESPGSSQVREETPESEALARVRELARRQDELTRLQRDLAARQAQMSPEEYRRRLERLTRDQSELRRQAEELARELGQRQEEQQRAHAGETGESSGAGGGGGSRMREVTEEMRSAASDLQRQDAQSAASRGDRALERLRDLERQLRGAQPDERRRVLGELRLEAQQIADAQRRIADEARHVAEGETGNGTGGRLAGEQARLADRVDRLGRDIGELAGAAGGGDERMALNEAAGELERGQVSERMRESAARLRGEVETGARGGRAGQDPAPDPGATEREPAAGELARALERVAERLGAAGGPDRESRRLSDQLARARDLRERLGALERRIEELARQADETATADEGPQARGEGDPDGSGGGQGQGSQAGTDGRDGAGDQQAGGSGGMAGELARLQEEYNEGLRRARELLGEIRGDGSAAGGAGPTPEEHFYNLSAPGTEAFKQDFARWDVLRRDVRNALELLEAMLSEELLDRETRDRLSAGADERTPEEYRRLVEKYYRSLAQRP